jgi:hypothetical protein
MERKMKIRLKLVIGIVLIFYSVSTSLHLSYKTRIFVEKAKIAEIEQKYNAKQFHDELMFVKIIENKPILAILFRQKSDLKYFYSFYDETGQFLGTSNTFDFFYKINEQIQVRDFNNHLYFCDWKNETAFQIDGLQLNEINFNPFLLREANFSCDSIELPTGSAVLGKVPFYKFIRDSLLIWDITEESFNLIKSCSLIRTLRYNHDVLDWSGDLFYDPIIGIFSQMICLFLDRSLFCIDTKGSISKIDLDIFASEQNLGKTFKGIDTKGLSYINHGQIFYVIFHTDQGIYAVEFY